MKAKGFTTEQKRIILDRDGHKCAVCGKRATEANHRANRGMGGSMDKNRLSNGCAICTRCNGEIESNPVLANIARNLGVKLKWDDDPEVVTYFHPVLMMRVRLFDDGSLELAA